MTIFLLFLLFVRLRFLRKNIIYGIAQDLFVAFELSLFPSLIQLFLLSAAELFLLFDALLYRQIKTRFHPSHLYFFRQAASFWDSAAALGIYRFFWTGGALVLATVFLPAWSLPWPIGFLSLFVSIVGVFRLSPHEAYHADNALFRLQLYLLPRKKQAVHPLALPPFLLPKGEEAAYVSPQFPLLKFTSGFHGEKKFQVSIKQPNVVFLFLESFRARDVNARATPFFESLKSKGLFFSQFYSNGVMTHQGVIAALYGCLPFFGCHRDRSVFDEPRQKADFATLPLIGIPDLLRQAGYKTAYIDAALALDSEKQFYRDHGFDIVQGRDDFSGSAATSWGVYDEYLMRHLAAHTKQEKEKPFFTVGFTVSNHHPWAAPEDYSFDLFDDVEDEVYRKFLRTLRYTDHCLELFFQEADLENTIIFIMGDHGQGMGEHGLERFQNSVYEENIHIPLLILGPGIKPQVIEAPASQVDLLPTVMDMLGLKGLNHAMGKSLVRQTPSAPLFFNNSHIGFSLGCRVGDKKYIMSDILQKKHEMFDLKNDPLERNPLLPDAELRKMAEECYGFMFALYERGNIAFTLNQTIDCAGKVKMTDAELEQLLRESCKPYALDLSGCLSITDAGLAAIAPHCTHLRSLNLSQCMVTEKGLQAVLRKAPHLKQVDLTDCLLMEQVDLNRREEKKF